MKITPDIINKHGIKPNEYKKIIPCGIKNKGVTSLKDLGIKNYSNINLKIKLEKKIYN